MHVTRSRILYFVVVLWVHSKQGNEKDSRCIEGDSDNGVGRQRGAGVVFAERDSVETPPTSWSTVAVCAEICHSPSSSHRKTNEMIETRKSGKLANAA